MNDRFKFRAWNGEKMIYNANNNSPLELMQCTGLKDKNGKLIYEGDIVKVENEDIAQIKWKQDSLMFYISYIHGYYFSDFSTYKSGDLQVIGNIYETPELLEDNNVNI